MTRLDIIPTRIVAVHGVGNGFDADASPSRREELRALKAAAWTRHLSGGLGIAADRIDLDFAYYADKLTAGSISQGARDGDFLHDALAQEMLDTWAQELGVPERVSQGYATIPVRALAAWVATRFDLAEGPLRGFIRVLFGEVAAYLRSADAPERVAAREEVATRIARHRPRMVIAHSLGSVVAYEALHAHPELEPELFLTLGSPLALPRVVFDRLVPVPQDSGGQMRGTRMPGRTRWLNIADPGDPVAIPPRLSQFFDGVDGDHTDAIHMFDFHQARNYLKCAATAAAIAPCLQT